jgi:hypothetical protein
MASFYEDTCFEHQGISLIISKSKTKIQRSLAYYLHFEDDEGCPSRVYM